jgi:hypothetical protein
MCISRDSTNLIASTNVNCSAFRKSGVAYVVLLFFFLLDDGWSFRLYFAALADWTAASAGLLRMACEGVVENDRRKGAGVLVRVGRNSDNVVCARHDGQ